MSTKRILTTALLLTACAFIISLVYNPLPIPTLGESGESTDARVVELSGRTIRVELADTPEEREEGLSGRDGLDLDTGMLFVFQEDGRHTFWMKDMHFSIDILWISRGGVIVDMEEGISPETYPAVFTPREEARYVLELPAGYSKEYDVHVGDTVRL